MTKASKIVIPVVDWHLALAYAIKNSVEETVIVVANAAMKEQGEKAASRMGKMVKFEIEESQQGQENSDKGNFHQVMKKMVEEEEIWNRMIEEGQILVGGPDDSFQYAAMGLDAALAILRARLFVPWLKENSPDSKGLFWRMQLGGQEGLFVIKHPFQDELDRISEEFDVRFWNPKNYRNQNYLAWETEGRNSFYISSVIIGVREKT